MVVVACNPQSWANRDNYDAATSETFNSANIVIDGLEVDVPTTRMSGECGQPGEFMQIPVGYIQWSLSNMTRNSGHPGISRLMFDVTYQQPSSRKVGWFDSPAILKSDH